MDMMDDDLAAALTHALSCLRRPGKEKQVEAIKNIYEGKDVLPTGYGKSICFHSLPFLFDYKLGRVSLPLNKHSVVLVVSPLVFLMSNQVVTLREGGVGAAILSGNKGIDNCLLTTAKDIKSGSQFCSVHLKLS